MKSLSILFVFSLFLGEVNSQNLVPNPSFEDSLACPVFHSEIAKAKYWDDCGPGTSDYLNSCAMPGSPVDVPVNMYGNQFAATGHAYAGIFCYLSNEYREYLATKLTATLTIGQKYYFRMSVSRSDDTTTNDVCINKLGVRFSTGSCTPTSYSDTNAIYPDNFAHIYTNTIIKDKTGWTAVIGSFVADSAYQYMTIGNFFDNAHTNVIIGGTGNSWAYYFIDDVCLTTNPNLCSLIAGLDKNNPAGMLEIYPNPNNGIVNILNTEAKKISSIRVKNIDGKEVLYLNTIDSEKTILDLTSFKDGMYFLEIQIGSTIINKRLIKN